MAQKKNKRVAPSSASLSSSRWDGAVGAIVCLIVFLVPFFPDEKVVRLKLEALELGLFVTAAVAGLRFLFLARWETSAEKLPKRPLVAAVLLWAGVAVILWALSAEKALANREIRRVLLGAASFLIFAFADLNEVWLVRFFRSWTFAAGLLAVYGLLEASGGVGPVLVPRMDRVMGTYGNPIFFAAFLLPSIFLTAGAIRLERKEAVNFLLWISLALQVAALYFTKTRAAWVAAGAAVAIGMALTRERRLMRLGIVLPSVAAACLFAYATRSVWARDQGHLMIWRDTARMWLDHPFKGVGLGAFHTNFLAYAGADLRRKWPETSSIVNFAHNEYLQTLAEGGVLLFAAFMAVVVFFLREARRLAAEESVEFSALFSASLGGTALLIQNLFSVDMRFGVSFAMFFIIAGLVVSGARREASALWQSKTGRLACGPDAVFAPERWAAAAVWSGLLAVVVLPALLKPYIAQRQVNAAPSFFDERLLDPAKSIDDLEKLAAQYSNEPAVLEKLAYVYAKELKTPDGKLNESMAAHAVDAYKKLLAADPMRMSAYNNLGNIYYTIGQTTLAIEMWSQAVTLKPDFIDGHLNLGKVLYVQGRLKESAAHFETVLKLDPGNAEAIVYLKKMVE